MADIAQYSNFYSINPSTGEVTFNHSSVYTAPFTVVTSPSGESELMEIETGGGNFLGLLFAGVDDQNNIFAEDGNVYFTNAVYSVGSFVPNYAETYASRDTNAYVACFLSDTMILTPNGKCAVQRLAIGDMVSTSDGRSVPVKWIGRQTVASAPTADERLVAVEERLPRDPTPGLHAVQEAGMGGGEGRP